MKRFSLLRQTGIMFILTLVLAVATGGSADAAGNELTIKGSTTVLPVAQVMAEVFMDRNPDVDISVQGGGSGVGIASLLDGTTDIADSSRKIKDKEIAKAEEKGMTPHEIVIAMDGIAVIVHPSNILSYLSKEQIKAIYTGKVSNWAEIGGEDRKIVVVSRDTSSGTFEAFENLALDKEKVRPDALTTASNQAVVMTVASSPNAIGYAGLGYLTDKVKPLRVDEVECTRETILSGAYPLSRPLFMYTKGEPEGGTKLFIDFILSEEGQKLVDEEGFVGLK
ncbi:MAG TPA: PstS family phosphate ABC transporter substrate-binding protein [Deltaproteobacteria bacterium]|nr:PstS family phosphate ABC transporter substrate-binding protein [Deltaproteobacteria bacterium]HPR53419.1 PstS family phosphate ABC transporter substrate-binding protein [Deltaproteobacteria bacterium]